MANKVIAGDYKGKVVAAYMLDKVVILLGITKRIEINSDTVDKYEVKSEGDRSAKKAVLGGMLFGGAGAVVGGVTAKKKNILVKIYFKDGKQSLLQINQKIYKLMLKNCM